MERLTSLLILLVVFASGSAFSQETKEKSKVPVKPALLVIDIQNVYLPIVPAQEKGVAMHYIDGLIQLFRSQGYPIIRIYHFDKENGPKMDTEQFEFPTSVLIKPEDTRVIKTYPDAFNKTDLDKILKEKGCNTLFLCGLSAVGCVLSTWIGAYNHDYKAFMVKNAIMSHNSEYTKNVEVMFDAVSYDMVKLLLESSAR